MRPRSSTRVFNPFSVSSFAAQPPLTPVPTTIASKELLPIAMRVLPRARSTELYREKPVTSQRSDHVNLKTLATRMRCGNATSFSADFKADIPIGYVSKQRGNTMLTRSEEHTSELQSPCNLVCRLLLEKK